MEVMLRNGRYALIDKGHEYVVACGYNEERKEWAQGYYYSHWNDSDIRKMCCLQAALDHYRMKVDKDYISRRRLEELATKFKDGLIESDEDFASEYFAEECELNESEMEFFELELVKEDK